MTHRPQRFQIYFQLQDGSGFTIKDCQFVFKYDKDYGWYDEEGNYYNQDGEPADPPEESESDHSQDKSEGSPIDEDDYYDQIAKEYEYNNQYDEEDEYNYEDLKNLEKIQINTEILSFYPQNKPLRVYYRNLEYHLNEFQILKSFRSIVPQIINVVPEINQQGRRNGTGYFILANKQSAKVLIQHEGKTIVNRPIYFGIQSIQQLLLYPIDQRYYEQQISSQKKKYKEKNGKEQKNTVEVKENKVEVKEEIKPQEEVKEVKLSKQEQVKVQKQQQQIKLPQSVETVIEKKQQVKVVEPQKDSNEWKSYTFQIKMFTKSDDAKQWLKTFGLENQIHYKQLKKLRTEEKTFGKITMRNDAYQKCNKQKYKQYIIEFTVL